MSKLSTLVQALPSMLSGTELIKTMAVFPDYDVNICDQPQAIRLMGLSSLYDIFIPSQMSMEIYSKLYLSLMHIVAQLARQKSKIFIMN